MTACTASDLAEFSAGVVVSGMRSKYPGALTLFADKLPAAHDPALWGHVAGMVEQADSYGVDEVGGALEVVILDLLARRGADKTICISEAARAIDLLDRQSNGDVDEGWRDLMEPARQAARRLVAVGAVVITQGGKVVDPATARGPIRVRLSQ
ncbi:MAG: hypothetical protein JWP74_4193 [Marmoricola sp.]|nr:hypothetical protein [Marmoricola sp.]